LAVVDLDEKKKDANPLKQQVEKTAKSKSGMLKTYNQET